MSGRTSRCIESKTAARMLSGDQIACCSLPIVARNDSCCMCEVRYKPVGFGRSER